ncbi:MAG: hypothetical protein Fur0025_07780 [Oscillatoriaceae cyanobacterium]
MNYYSNIYRVIIPVNMSIFINFCNYSLTKKMGVSIGFVGGGNEGEGCGGGGFDSSRGGTGNEGAFPSYDEAVITL